MLKDLFRKPKYVTVKPSSEGRGEPGQAKAQTAYPVKRDMPDGLWQKCRSCGEISYTKELERNLKVCPKCGHHYRLTALERLAYTVDEGSFAEMDAELSSGNPLDFPQYGEKLYDAQQATGLKEAIITGEATIGGFPVVIGIMDANFIMASMGSAVGEKITRAMEKALERKIPVIIFAASGGARMQEGILSLMQMAKTSGAVAKLKTAGVLYISVFTDPTTGGVTASFASVGDINLAEPGALIAFAGPRVIEQTIRQKLPESFQKAEFMLKHGFVDLVVPRGDMKSTLTVLLELHQPREGENAE
ncbi:MAG: acetyl-CoA carboxylase, carboxyltransferase subunit beta [Carboxydocellales bacterium]